MPGARRARRPRPDSSNTAGLAVSLAQAAHTPTRAQILSPSAARGTCDTEGSSGSQELIRWLSTDSPYGRRPAAAAASRHEHGNPSRLARSPAVHAEKPRPGHASRRYSPIRLPTRVCLRRRYCSRSTVSGSGFSGAAPFRDRCGRCRLWWISYWCRIRRRGAWFQTGVRSRSSRRHPPI
jgi:hypothetical protein